MLDVRPSAQPLLDALGRRLLALDADIVARQPAGGWTAWYLGPNVVVLARPALASAAGTSVAGAIEVAAPLIGWAASVSTSRELDDSGLLETLAGAIEAARLRRRTSGGSWAPSSGHATGLVALIELIGLLVVGLAVLIGFIATRLRPGGPGASPAAVEAARSLNAARTEATLRENSTTLGCLVAGAALTLAALIGQLLAEALFGAAGAGRVGLGVTAAIAFAVAITAFRVVRRRYPAPPQTRFERRLGQFLAIVGVVAVLGIGAVLAFGGSVSVITEEQAAWCLGPGAGYVNNAVTVLNLPRSWTAETARGDANFRLACSTAWSATHP